ncbi:hypothetical protein PFDG_05010, partial [Plasmodium falciparum Dd2]
MNYSPYDLNNQNVMYSTLHIEESNKTFINKYPNNYNIKENILIQICRHIIEHFSTLFNQDFISIHETYKELMNLKREMKKKTNIIQKNNPIKNYMTNLKSSNDNNLILHKKENQLQDQTNVCTRKKFSNYLKRKDKKIVCSFSRDKNKKNVPLKTELQPEANDTKNNENIKNNVNIIN